MSDFTVVDIETTGNDPWNHQLVAVGIGDCDGVTVHRPCEGKSAVLDLLEDPSSVIVAHSNYDLRWLILDGAPLPVDGCQYHDTKVMAFMLDQTQGELGLDDLAVKYLGSRHLRKPIKRRQGIIYYDCDEGFLYGGLGLVRIEDVPWDEMVAYNGQDVRMTAALYVRLRELLQESGQWEEYFLAEEAPLSTILIEMEVAGMPIDAEGTRQMLQESDNERQEIAEEIRRDTGFANFNLKSGDQVAAFLYDEMPTIKFEMEVPALKSIPKPDREAAVRKMLPKSVAVDTIGDKWVRGKQTMPGRGLKPPKTKMKKGREPKRPPIDAENLVLLYGSDPWVAKYLRWKSLDTLCTNYLEKWVEAEHNGRLHGRFDQARAETGRLASKDPNLQSIPVSMDFNVRQLFEAPLMIGDYSGLDVRVAAHFSEDPLMLEIFRKDMDLYGVLASEAFGGPGDKSNEHRGLMKILMLSAQYGSHAKSIGDKIRISGLGDEWADKSAKLLRQLEETLPRLFQWREEVLNDAKCNGYITTISGRRRYLPDLYSGEWWRKARAERQCVASQVQGTSADIVRRAMLKVRQAVPLTEARMVLQVHDEILWQRMEDWNDKSFDTIKGICDTGHEEPLYVPQLDITLPGFELLVPMKFSAGLGESWHEKDAVGARSYRVMSKEVV